MKGMDYDSFLELRNQTIVYLYYAERVFDYII